MRREVLAAGVPPEHVLVEEESQSTLDNAVNSARLMQAHGFRSAILVTSPYHTRRALWVFGFFQIFSNLGYALVAHVGPNKPVMYAAVAFELFSTGLRLTRNLGLVDPGGDDLTARRVAFAAELRTLVRRLRRNRW